MRSNRGNETVEARLPEFSVLSPVKASRREAVRRIVGLIGATGPNFLFAPYKIVDRGLTNEDFDSLLSELVNGTVARQFRLRWLFDHRASVTIGDIVPNELSYYARFCGPPPCGQGPESYIQDTLIPYRRKLLERDLRTGLDIGLSGALRDDLCPGQWLTDADDDILWDALARHRGSNNPFVLIAGIDVAAYRPNDPRFRKFSEDAIVALSKAMFSKDGSEDFQSLAAGLCDFVFSQINLVRGCAERPGYWKRMCAWMQAGQIVDAVARSSTQINARTLGKWVDENVTSAGLFGGLVDLKEEPMWSPTRSTKAVWNDEIVGRLCLLKGRHEDAGREIPGWDGVSKELSEAISEWIKGASRFRGPLEGHRIPRESIPQRIADELDGMWGGNPEYALRVLSNICLGFVVPETVLDRAREAVSTLPHDVRDSNFERLENASNVAARTRSTALAREIGAVAVTMAPDIESREHVLKLLLIILIASAAHEEHDIWVEWLDQTLTSVARSLPEVPSDCLYVFRECLDQFSSFVAMDSWFHLRASSVASSGS